MKRSAGFLATFLAVWLGAGASAHAHTISFNQTIDLSGISPKGSVWFSGADLHDIRVGDTLDWTVVFQPGQWITAQGLSMLDGVLLTTGPKVTVADNIHWALLGEGGTTLVSGAQAGGLRESGIVGGIVLTHDGLPTDTSFHGFHIHADVAGFESPGAASAELTGLGLFGIDASSIQITGVAGVPEPAAWAMLILGVAMIGSAVRRRQTAEQG